jgi:hypothetical protein
MKKLLFLITIMATFISCCKKDITPTPESTPLSQLPPATQTGANTFGCLLDGQVFKPGFYNNSYQCFYQLSNGGYYFNVNADYRAGGILKSVQVATENLQITEGQTLKLYERVAGNAYGSYYTGNTNTGVSDNQYTSSTNTGELKITKLDLIKDIVSGTFWFDIKDKSGAIHQVREGRFDMQFSQ